MSSGFVILVPLINLNSWENSMPNMDYPGPCPSCMGIDGCPTDAGKEEAVAHYCKGLEMELNTWKARLYDVFNSISSPLQ